MLGLPVARRLRADGLAVRVLTRSPEKAAALFGAGFEIMAGAIEDHGSLLQALDGCTGVHVNLKGGPRPSDYDRIEHRGTAAVVEAARQAGVKQLTYLSAYTIQEKNISSPESRAKFAAEQVIRASGIAHTIFRASWFMESLPLFIQGKQAIVIGKQPHPLHWVAAADYARMVSRSYQLPPAPSRALYVYGPQPFTMAQALQIYLDSLAPTIRLSTMAPWLLGLLGRVSFNAELVSTAELMGYYDRIGEEGDPREANELLGAPMTTLREWCAWQLQAQNNANKKEEAAYGRSQ